MSELRDQLASERDAYRAARYDGDLGGVVAASGRRRARGLAVAACAAALLAGVVLIPTGEPTDEPPPARVAAQTSSPTTGWVGRTKRVGKYRGAARRVAALVASREATASAGRRAWASPLAFARPEPSASPASAADGGAPARPSRPIPAAAPRSLSLSMSPPSLNLRSLDDAISFGT